MMHSSISRTVHNNSSMNLGPPLLLNHGDEHEQLKMRDEVAGVTLTRTELTLVLSMYICAVVFLVIMFEYLKPSLSAHLLGTRN
ncbi:unnamed protein product [Caenorhabditis bovis]|uniref:Uncharacterized protein n=1 Tax=Caenorhabditis bovis TaxID=2654633 RepID=A0A8S1EVV3_9PELO|nr:unnamed protein product [Caenorhabditis bovis]